MTAPDTRRLPMLDAPTNHAIQRVTCCQRNAYRLPVGCNEGRSCPERGYAPLRTAEGGETVDVPPYTQQQVARWSIVVWSIVAVCCAALVAVLAASRFN